MTDKELAAIEARAKDQDRLGSTADPATVLALVAEVRRLRGLAATMVSACDEVDPLGAIFVVCQDRCVGGCDCEERWDRLEVAINGLRARL